MRDVNVGSHLIVRLDVHVTSALSRHVNDVCFERNSRFENVNASSLPHDFDC